MKLSSTVTLAITTILTSATSYASITDLNKIPQNESNIIIFQRDGSKFFSNISFGLAGISDKSVSIQIENTDHPYESAYRRGFNKENFSMFQVSPGKIKITMRNWRATYQKEDNVTKQITTEGGKNYYFVWSPPSSNQFAGALFSQISEINARHQLIGRKCFGSKCGDLLDKKLTDEILTIFPKNDSQKSTSSQQNTIISNSISIQKDATISRTPILKKDITKSENNSSTPLIAKSSKIERETKKHNIAITTSTISTIIKNQETKNIPVVTKQETKLKEQKHIYENFPAQVPLMDWDTTSGKFQFTRANIHGWNLSYDKKRNLMMYNGWLCRDNTNDHQIICYGVNSASKNLFWIMNTAYQGQSLQKGIKSIIKLTKNNNLNNTIKIIRTYQNDLPWAGQEELGWSLSGNSVSLPPSDHESTWHPIPNNLREFLHDISPKKF